MTKMLPFYLSAPEQKPVFELNPCPACSMPLSGRFIRPSFYRGRHNNISLIGCKHAEQFEAKKMSADQKERDAQEQEFIRGWNSFCETLFVEVMKIRAYSPEHELQARQTLGLTDL